LRQTKTQMISDLFYIIEWATFH